MGFDVGLGRLLEMVKEQFGQKPYMATLLLVWAAVVAGSLGLIWALVVSPAVRIAQNIITWLGEGTTPISITSVVQNGIILAIVIVLLAIMWNRMGRRLPRVDQDSERIINLEKDKPRWEHTEADLRNLESEFRRYGERLVVIERQLGSIADKVNPQPSFEPANIRNQVIVTYQSASLDLSGISRTLTLWCTVKNVSAAWIWPTCQVAGHLIYEAYSLVSTRWEVEWQSPGHLDSMGSAKLGLVFHVDQRLAEDLAFKAENGEFYSDLSELRVEFMARDAEFHQASIGWLNIGEKQTVRIQDGINASRIRAYVNWREGQF